MLHVRLHVVSANRGHFCLMLSIIPCQWIKRACAYPDRLLCIGNYSEAYSADSVKYLMPSGSSGSGLLLIIYRTFTNRWLPQAGLR
jgi:hypothetical protein